MVWLIYPDNAKMLLDTPFQMNYILINQLASNSVDIYLNNTLQKLCKSLLCFAKIGRLTAQNHQIWLVKFCMFNFKIVDLAQFSTGFNNLALSNMKEIMKIKQKTFVLLLIKRQYFYGGHPVCLKKNF